MKEKCEICHMEKPLLKCLLKVLSIKGWEEIVVEICKECMISEEISEITEKDEENKAA